MRMVAMPSVETELGDRYEESWYELEHENNWKIWWNNMTKMVG